MKPDQRWFPTNRVERASWFGNFTENFAQVGPRLGFTQADVDSVRADNEVVQYMAAVVNSLENTMRAVRTYERSITGGRIGTTQPQFPAVGVPPMPPPVAPGIYERLEKLVRRIRVAPDYTSSIGASLGIIPNNGPRVDFAEIVPKLTVQAKAAPHSFRVRCPRGKFRAIEVWIQRAGQIEWEIAGILTSSPSDVVVKPTAPGVPEKISVRTRMRAGSEIFSRFSDIAEVTLNG